MFAAVMSDTMAMESPAIATEAEFVRCECCGLTEECTAAYIEKVRERYHGKWICGLCGEAVNDEILRSKRLITTEEAMARHVSFRRRSSSVDPPPVHLIAAVRQILRRSLESPPGRSLRSMPNSPLKNDDCVRLRRSESCCFTNLTVDETTPYTELQD